MSPKEKIALSSIFASLAVATLKLVTGILTNSLGILSEGLHSAIDLIAVSATFFAVRKADSPPDFDHQYGHGKAENLASLLESALLLIVAIWIFYEAFERFFIKEVQLAITLPSITVILIAIFIDATRFRALSITCKKYHSPALEADALHFSTDLLSTSVVLVGSLLIFFGIKLVDSIVAFVVAIVILTVSYRLGRKSINVLMDRAPIGVVQLIKEEAKKIKGVEKIDQVRVRESGSKMFVDLVVCVDKLSSLEVAHSVAENLSKHITSIIPGAEVLVHTEPLLIETSSIISRIREVASSFSEIKNIHNIRVSEINKKLYVDFHLELDGSLPLNAAHSIASELEKSIKSLDPAIEYVTSHIEPIDGGKLSGLVDTELLKSLNRKIQETIKEFPEIIGFHGLKITRIDERFSLSLHCVFKESLTVQASHKITERLEALLRNEFKELESVTVHIEPEKE